MCIFQLMIDNGSEFKGAVQLLMDKYKVPIIQVSPYNPQENGNLEHGHAVWISALWKISAICIYNWPDYLGYTIWADHVTVKQNTGYTPYYLLYGQHLLMPYDVMDWTFHSLDWRSVEMTEDLLPLRILQISKEELLDEAFLANEKSWWKAADAFNRRHAAHMATGEYAPSKWVIVYNESLDNQHGSKGLPSGSVLLLLFSGGPQACMSFNNWMASCYVGWLHGNDSNYTIFMKIKSWLSDCLFGIPMMKIWMYLLWPKSKIHLIGCSLGTSRVLNSATSTGCQNMILGNDVL
jgi:hypothetical protein